MARIVEDEDRDEKVQRYRLTAGKMYPTFDGEYVGYEDYAELKRKYCKVLYSYSTRAKYGRRY